MQKTALITGGGSGIGQAIAYKLVEKDWQVVIVGRNAAKLERCKEKYPEAIKTIQADLADLDSLEKISNQFDCDKLDCLVHNAAIIDPIHSIKNVSLEDFETLMRINVTSVLGLTQALLPKLSGGRVLFISSGAATFAINEWSAYCTSKAALHMLKLAFQTECKDVHFADVRPGIVKTPMIDHVMSTSFEGVDFFKELDGDSRLLEPSVVGAFLSWLVTAVPEQHFGEATWDIYDTNHHAQWLGDGVVPAIE